MLCVINDISLITHITLCTNMCASMTLVDCIGLQQQPAVVQQFRSNLLLIDPQDWFLNPMPVSRTSCVFRIQGRTRIVRAQRGRAGSCKRAARPESSHRDCECWGRDPCDSRDTEDSWDSRGVGWDIWDTSSTWQMPGQHTWDIYSTCCGRAGHLQHFTVSGQLDA